MGYIDIEAIAQDLLDRDLLVQRLIELQRSLTDSCQFPGDFGAGYELGMQNAADRLAELLQEFGFQVDGERP